jgi:hypothetical protein
MPVLILLRQRDSHVALFHKLDADKDSLLSEEELKALWKR